MNTMSTRVTPLEWKKNQQSGPLGDDVKGGEAGVLGVANLDAQNDALPHSILNFRVLK